jgi:uncharacterized protein YlxW (UPF0749 family)
VTGPSPVGDRPRGRTGDFLTELFRTPLDPGYAQAARRRAGGAPPTGGLRRGTATAIRLAALIVIGFLLAVAYRHAAAAQPETGRARAGLVADVRARRDTTDEMQKRADQLRERVAAERDAALSDAGEGSRLRDQEAQAGLARVRGDGVVVGLADAPPPIDPVTGKRSSTNPGRILDRDLQDISNELWRLGAEAIAINGERLTATTTIRAAGDAILVDFRPITTPYEVSAIGPDNLTDRFAGSATAKRFGTYVHTYRLRFSVKQRDGITLPAATEPRLRYARTPPTASGAPGASGTGSASGSPVPSASGGGK